MFEKIQETTSMCGPNSVLRQRSKRSKILFVVVVLLFCLCSQLSATENATLVIPNGFETLEGNSRMTEQMEDGGVPGFRQQLLLSHLQFASVHGPIWITGFATRPDAKVTGPREFTYFDVEWRLSTTKQTPETMSIRFAENTGADETLAYAGDWTLSTKGGQGLKDFDYILELKTPFYYDPSQGDILFDFSCRGGFSGTPTDSAVMDGQWISERTHFCSVSSPDPDRSFGEPVWEDWIVIQKFTYRPVRSPELQGDINRDQKADCADICFMIENWQKNEPFCDIAPEPLGDDIVDEQDLMLLMEYIDVNSLVAGGNTDCNCVVDTEDATLVIPNGFEYLEGNSWQLDNVGDLYPSGAREQEIFSREQFTSIGGPILITGAYYRPDAQVTTPREFTYFDMEIRLSTTDKTPRMMSNEFAKNIGPDETLVYFGDCTLSTPGRDSLEDFDYAIEYQQPFYYDPSKGNLLADYTIRGPSSGTPTNSPVFDGQWISNKTHYCDLSSKNPDNERGTFSGDWTCVFQFSYRPVRSPNFKGDLNTDGKVNSEDICFLIKQWQTDDIICDIYPQPAGDGIVNAQDLIQLVKYLNMDPPIAHWQLDESEGDIAHDSIYINNAFVLGDAIWQPEGGYLGGALEFDGVNDYVQTDFVLDPGQTSFGTFAWIKGGIPGQVIISQLDGNGTGEIWLCADTLNGNLMTGLVPRKVGWITPQPLVSESVITDIQWHHVGFVWDGSYRALYVDGIEVAKDKNAQNPLNNADGGLYIGVSKDLDAASFFSGMIDDVRIYDKALSKEEIDLLAH